MDKKLKVVAVNSIVVRMDNSNDPERTHEIAADVTINNSGVESFYNGTVNHLPESGRPGSASFHEFFNNGESSVTYSGVDKSDRPAMLDALDTFFATAHAQAADILTAIQPQAE